MNEGFPTTRPATSAQLLAQLTGAATLAIGAMLCGAGTAQAATIAPPTADGSRWSLSHDGGAVAPAWSNQAAWLDRANVFASGSATLPEIALGGATRGLFSADASSVSVSVGAAERARFTDTSHYFGIGRDLSTVTTLAPFSGLHYHGPDGNNVRHAIWCYKNSVGGATAQFVLGAMQGTAAAPAATAASDIVSQLLGGHDGSIYRTTEAIRFQAVSAWTPTSLESQVSIYTCASGAVTPTERVRFASNGQTYFQNGTAALPSVSFFSSSTDGFFRSAGSVIGTSIAGVERMRFQSDRLIINANASAWYSPGISNLGLNGLSFYGADGVAIGMGGSAVGNDVRFIGRRANGTALVPTAVGSGDDLLNIQASGYDGTGFTGDRARITADAAETWSATGHGTLWRFYVTAVGATALAEALSIGGAGITAYQPILAAAGSVSLPSLSFSSDPNTGIYSNGADILSFATGGVERFRLSATGRSAFGSGNAAAPGIGFLSDGATGMRLVGTGSLALVTGGVDALSISAAQLVSIPSTADGALTVAGRITAKAAVPATFADLAAVRTYLASIIT